MKKRIQQTLSFLMSLTLVISLTPNIVAKADSGKFASNNYYIGEHGPHEVDTTLPIAKNGDIVDVLKSYQTSTVNTITTQLNYLELDTGGIEADLCSNDTNSYPYSACLVISTGNTSLGNIYIRCIRIYYDYT